MSEGVCRAYDDDEPSVIRKVSIRRLPEIATVVRPEGQVYVVKQLFLSDFLSKKERDFGREEGYAENKIEASSAESAGSEGDRPALTEGDAPEA